MKAACEDIHTIKIDILVPEPVTYLVNPFSTKGLNLFSDLYDPYENFFLYQLEHCWGVWALGTW